MYEQLIAAARKTGDPAREAKCRAIRREAQDRVDASITVAEIPDNETIMAWITAGRRVRAAFGFLREVVRILKYGRAQCRLMIDRPLPYVIAYDPATDTGWP